MFFDMPHMEAYRKEVLSRVVGNPLDVVTNQVFRFQLYVSDSAPRNARDSLG